MLLIVRGVVVTAAAAVAAGAAIDVGVGWPRLGWRSFRFDKITVRINRCRSEGGGIRRRGK